MSSARRYKKDSAGRWRDEQGRFASPTAIKRQRKRRVREREREEREEHEREQGRRRQERHRAKAEREQIETEFEKLERETDEIISAPMPEGSEWLEILPKGERMRLRLRVAELEGRFDEEARKVADEEGMTPHDVYTWYLSPDAAA